MIQRAISATRLAAMLGGWSDAGGPLRHRLVAGLRRLIEGGELPPLTRLPSERSLAQVLSVSRSTVVATYEALRVEALVASRQGSGTWVTGRRQRPDQLREDLSSFPWMHRIVAKTDSLGHSTDVIDLSGLTLRPVAPLSELYDISPADWKRLADLEGYQPLGLEDLREAVAEEFSRQGAVTSADHVVITAGAQQALSLVAAALLQPGDVVAVEDPAYPGLLPICQHAEVRLLPVPVDEHGLQVDVLREVLSRQRVGLLFCTPTCHNPTGTTLPEARRRALAQLAAEQQLMVVEDLALADLYFEPPAPPPLAAYGDGSNTITIGSLSALSWSGLRVGWVRSPGGLALRLARVKGTWDLGGSPVDQLVAARALSRVHDLRLLRRRELAGRCRLVEGLLADLLPDWAWPPPSGGATLWVRLPLGVATDFVQVALRHGVAILPGSAFSVSDEHRDCLRLPFVLAPPQLEEGVRRLAHAWHDYRARL